MSSFISLISAFVVAACVNTVPAQVETFTTLRGALDEVAAKYRIQVGLEYSAQDKYLQPITLDLSARSVDAVLNQLVNQKPDYLWSLDDNVYDVYPKSNPDSILDVRLREFTMKELSSKEAASVIGEIPEIKEWLTSRSVSRQEFCAGSCDHSSEKLMTVSLKDVTFRTLLNTLIRDFGNCGLDGGPLRRQSRVYRDLSGLICKSQRNVNSIWLVRNSEKFSGCAFTRRYSPVLGRDNLCEQYVVLAFSR